MAAGGLHGCVRKGVARDAQRSRYARMSRRLSALSQLPESFLSRELQNYQAVVAEYVSGVRA